MAVGFVAQVFGDVGLGEVWQAVVVLLERVLVGGYGGAGEGEEVCGANEGDYDGEGFAGKGEHGWPSFGWVAVWQKETRQLVCCRVLVTESGYASAGDWVVASGQVAVAMPRVPGRSA